MSKARTIPWKRIAVEAAAIVLSILLAFAIDAWWAEKSERAIEQEALETLRGDFLASSENLAGLLLALSDARVIFARFASATPAELASMDSDSVRPIIGSFVITATFDPLTATLDSLSNDGRLGLISDPELLRHLSSWQRSLDDIRANNQELRAESLRVRRAMEKHGGPFNRWGRSLDDIELLKEADGKTLAMLWEDEEFMGKARSHHYALSGYLWELRGLDENLNAILMVLDRIIAQR